MRLCRAVALASAAIALCAPVARAASSPEATWLAVDEAVRDTIVAGDIPGAVVIVGTRDRVLYRKAQGARATAPKVEPMLPDTIFDIASLTKVVATTPAILWLWEQGKLELDAPIGRYLKEFNGPAHREVTVRRVLTHSAGFPDIPPLAAVKKGPAGLLAALGGMELRYNPGTTFHYSDTGFIVLAELARRVSGEPLDQLMTRRFYVPLGMRHTAFKPPATWRPQIAPTEALSTGMLRGVVHDGNARLLGGVTGHAGLFSTADDLSKFCAMLLGGGSAGGRRYLKTATIEAMLEPQRIGETTRALGWDMASPYSTTLGSYFPPGSIGHTGFTGTSIWMDPAAGVYNIILTNRVHPYGKGRVVDLRRRISAEVGAAFAPANGVASAVTVAPDAVFVAPEPRPPTRTGLDQLVASGFAPLAGRVVGLLTNHTGLDARGRRGVDLLHAAPGVSLRAVFSPEHGLDGKIDANVAHGRDTATGLPVWSLYGAERRPSAAMLGNIDTLVFDMQDVGVRYYTYLTTLVYVLEEASRRKLSVVVLDRPNPLTGRWVEGPLMDPDLRSFTAPHAIPVRTGMTMGEFARMVVAERRLPVALTVIPMENWERTRWWEDTGLGWVNPSPNIRTPMEALLYAGVGLLEATNLSVGRGTDVPFEVVGAPWVGDPARLVAALNQRALPGVRFEPARFTPSSSVYAGQAVSGVKLVVTDRESFRPVATGLALARELMDVYPAHFRPAAIQNLMVNRSTMWALLRREPLSSIWSRAEADRASFLQRRASYLIYR